MTIGFDASRVNFLKKTGVEWYSYYLICGLKKLDQQNHYFLYTPKPLNNELLPLPENFQEKILHWPIKNFWTVGRLSLEMIINKPDLLFVPSHTLPLVKAKKNLITWHDLAYQYYPNYYQQKELISLRNGGRRLAKIADKIITISEFSKNELIKFYNLAPEKVEVVYLGCDSENYDLEKIKNIDFKKYNLTKPYLTYLGRLELKKNLINLIKAFNFLKEEYHHDLQLALIGSPGYQNHLIIKEIRNSPYREDIKLLGWLNDEEKKFILGQGKVFVFPSYYEGFGLPIIEAMALEVPVAASNVGALPEIGAQAALYFSPDDFQEMAETINKIITDKALREFLIKAGRDRIKNFTWQKCCEKTLLVINNLLTNQ